MDINLKGSDSLVIQQNSNKNWNLPMYIRHGMRDGKTLLELLNLVEKPVFDVYMVLYKCSSKKNNITTLSRAKTTVIGNNQTRYINVLEKLDIVRKVKREQLRNIEGIQLLVPKRTYMLNPNLLIPVRNDDFEGALYYWNQLPSKYKK